ncbi:MAG: hypothetical protein NTX65_06655 [Ignavibacteriales bacterium]|nr:hypothetical protein [Ignavibacteriales bacterium]
MNVLTINHSNPKLDWTKLQNISEKKDRAASSNIFEPSSFVPEFPSPADEVKKTISKTEAQNSDKRSRPFSHTSENWIG